MNHIDCPNCGHHLKYGDEHSGKKAKCQKCGAGFTLPSSHSLRGAANDTNAEVRPNYDVFISYSSKDKQWADGACAVLEGRRIRCWIAPRDITPGSEWGAAIIGGIDACRLMVLIFSANANESAQVRREVERAISKGLTVLPLRVEDIRPAGAMEYALSNTHWLDAFTPPVERQFEILGESVHVLLTRAQDATDSKSPSPSSRRTIPMSPRTAAVLDAARSQSPRSERITGVTTEVDSAAEVDSALEYLLLRTEKSAQGSIGLLYYFWLLVSFLSLFLPALIFPISLGQGVLIAVGTFIGVFISIWLYARIRYAIVVNSRRRREIIEAAAKEGISEPRLQKLIEEKREWLKLWW